MAIRVSLLLALAIEAVSSNATPAPIAFSICSRVPSVEPFSPMIAVHRNPEASRRFIYAKNCGIVSAQLRARHKKRTLNGIV
jgi:hypothetical protein